MKLAVIPLALATTAAAAAPQQLDMVEFFTGKAHADNVLKVAFKPPVKLIVDSVGGKGDRGDFVLIEKVKEGDKPERTRKWVMKPDGPNHFTGSLTDATGPVDIKVGGRRAIIRYTMTGGLHVTQQLDLQSDGSLSNHIVVRKFGMKFGSVQGTIRKLD